LITFVAEQSSRVPPGQRVPGSTEVLESSWGRWKSLEGDQQKDGFTHLVFSYAAQLGETTTELIATALKHTPRTQVQRWCQSHLGETLQSKRLSAHRAVTPTAAQQNLEESEYPATPAFQLASPRVLPVQPPSKPGAR
jgi:hypothetical protein